MKINSQSIMGALAASRIALNESGPYLSLAFARAVAYRLPLPTGPVENPHQYYIETHKTTTEQMLGEINERIVVNIDAAADLCQRLWTFRYRMVHDANNSAVRGFLDAMVKVGSRELPPSVSELLIKNDSSDLLELITRAVGLSIEEA